MIIPSGELLRVVCVVSEILGNNNPCDLLSSSSKADFCMEPGLSPSFNWACVSVDINNNRMNTVYSFGCAFMGRSLRYRYIITVLVIKLTGKQGN